MLAISHQIPPEQLEQDNQFVEQVMMVQIHLKRIYQRQLMFQENIINKINKKQNMQWFNLLFMTPTQESQFRQTIIYTLLNMVIETVPSGLLSHLSQWNVDYIKEWNEIIEQFIDQLPMNNIIVIEQITECLSHYYCTSNLKINLDKLYSKYYIDEQENLNNYFVFLIFRKLFLLVNIDKITNLIPKNIITWFNQQQDVTKSLDIQQHSISERINIYLQQKLNGIELFEQIKLISYTNAEIIIQTFLECLLIQISKSITHLNVLSKRYLSFLLQPNILKQEKLAEILLNTIYLMWSHSIFHLKLYLKEFLSLEVINNLQMIK